MGTKLGCGVWGSMEVRPKAQVSFFFVAFPNNINLYFRQGHKLLQVINVLKIKNTNVSLAEGVYNHIYQPSSDWSTRLPPATLHRPLYLKWPTGSGNGSNLRLLDPPINFR